MLRLPRVEFDGFLKERHIYEHAYDVEDLEQDQETVRQLHSRVFLSDDCCCGYLSAQLPHLSRL